MKRQGDGSSWELARAAGLAGMIALAAAGCSKKNAGGNGDVTDANLVRVGITSARVIGDGQTKLKVSPQGLLDGAAADPSKLILGLPADLLGKQNVFGAVITKVSDAKSSDLGMLKLTDLPAIPVVPQLAKLKDGQVVLALMGCVEKCTPDKETEALVTLPVVSLDDDKQLINIDLSAVGSDFDLMGILDPKGEYTKLVTKSAQTTAIDFSKSTLVFDVDSHLVPVKPDPEKPAPETIITARWYLKLNPVTDPNFVPRDPVAAAGFFKTERGATTRITRYSAEAGTIKYYIKGVPAQFQAGFAAAFDGWNAELKDILGHELFEYEFVGADDPRYPLLVTGDVRYNIVEWDVNNVAPYGGLGPSIADQLTGQTFASNVLVQGPSIIDLYTKWFASSDAARKFEQLGMNDVADKLMLKTKGELEAKRAPEAKLKLTMGGKLAFRVVGQLPELYDPVVERTDFDLLPEGETFESYMPGYFQDMITHELGHNLGLRHNFRGTLGSKQAEPELGEVSRSIMDYMGRDFRYLDRLGDYDRMAISYGYLGKAPEHSDWFCTDEDQGGAGKPDKSAECSQDDATPDPFSFFEARLERAIDLLINRGQSGAPTWKVDDMGSVLKSTVGGLLNYAESAEKTASTWTNFFGKPGRPADAAGVKAYVVAALKKQLCDDAGFAGALAQKESDSARDAAKANITALRAKVADLVKPYKAVSAADVACP